MHDRNVPTNSMGVFTCALACCRLRYSMLCTHWYTITVRLTPVTNNQDGCDKFFIFFICNMKVNMKVKNHMHQLQNENGPCRSSVCNWVILFAFKLIVHKDTEYISARWRMKLNAVCQAVRSFSREIWFDSTRCFDTEYRVSTVPLSPTGGSVNERHHHRLSYLHRLIMIPNS